MLKPAIDDCFVSNDRWLTHAAALALLRERIACRLDVEDTGIEAALGRRLGVAIAAAAPVPAHTNAAVDGYAFAAGAYDRTTGSSFAVQGRAAAGHPLASVLAEKSAARIFTGAVMPVGADTVVMQEDCRRDGDHVHVPSGLRVGANVRRAGEDVAVGATLFEPGHVVRPQDLAALASIGLTHVPCYRRLRVAVVANGDEVVATGAGPLLPGQVFDANTPMLQALAALAGADITNLGIWRDELATVTRQLRVAADRFDVVITSGGASRGEEDHMGAALGALGTRHFWQLAVKPGRPMMFGQIAKSHDPATAPSIVVGLPGNPVAVFVCFLMYVFPLLQRLGGGQWREPRRYRLPATFSFTGRKRGRREFWRGTLVDTPAGLAVDKFARDGSGLISGLRAADGLIDIPEDTGDVAAGDVVDFIPFTEFGIAR